MRTTTAIVLAGLAVALSGCSSSPVSGSATASITSSPAGTGAGQSPAAGAAPAASAAPPASLEPTSVPSQPASEVPTVNPQPFTLTSPAFDEGGAIPRQFTCDGASDSPAISWSGAPEGTRSLVLAITDPDARGFVHWVAYNLPGTPAGGLPMGIAPGAKDLAQGTNDFGKRGYGGPCPPSGTHHYRFTLSALDVVLELPGAPRLHDLKGAMAGHILAEATLTGSYHRS